MNPFESAGSGPICWHKPSGMLLPLALMRFLASFLATIRRAWLCLRNSRSHAGANCRAWQCVGVVNNAASASLLGPVQKLDAHELVRLYAINVAIPTWLMGFVAQHSHRGAMIRIVNVSSGAAVRAFPGLAAYCGSKAALRMAGMAFAAELESPLRTTATSNLAILSYEPGVADTEMQLATRSKSREDFPWVETFRGFAAQGALVAPAIPAAEIAEFLEADGRAHFIEHRRGG